MAKPVSLLFIRFSAFLNELLAEKAPPSFPAGILRLYFTSACFEISSWYSFKLVTVEVLSVELQPKLETILMSDGYLKESPYLVIEVQSRAKMGLIMNPSSCFDCVLPL